MVFFLLLDTFISSGGPIMWFMWLVQEMLVLLKYRMKYFVLFTTIDR